MKDRTELAAHRIISCNAIISILRDKMEKFICNCPWKGSTLQRKPQSTTRSSIRQSKEPSPVLSQEYAG